MNETIRMQLSAYVDGELPDSEAELLLRRLSQDAELRAEVAEFIEIGRTLRGEYSINGIHNLRQRVAEALDSDAVEPVAEEDARAERSFAKPLGGLAVAAAVAVVAIIGLQQTGTVTDNPAAVAGDAEIDAGYVVPPQDAEMREYLRMHGESTSAQGANGMNVRIVSFPLRDEVELEDSELDETAPPDDAPATEGSDAGSIEE